jgi:hypothetical protein
MSPLEAQSAIAAWFLAVQEVSIASMVRKSRLQRDYDARTCHVISEAPTVDDIP